MLVGTDCSRVEHHVLIVAIFGQGLEDTLENAAFTPLTVPLVGILPTAEALRKIAPANAGAVAENDGLDKKAIIRRGATDMTFTATKKILDPLSLIVPQSMTSHRSAPQRPTFYESHQPPK